MCEERGEAVGFALDEDGTNRRDEEEKLFEIGEGDEPWRRVEGERERGASAVDGVGDVHCVEGEGALVMVGGVLVGERVVTSACFARRVEAGRRENGPLTLEAWGGYE